MASVFGHSAAALGIFKIFPKRLHAKKVAILGIISSTIPDIDVMAYSFGIDSHHILGHRGLTHSLIFAVLWSILLVFLFHKSENRKKLFFIYYALSMASHGILDSMTNGGNGIAFLYPLTEERYFFPLRFIQVSPIGVSNFFSEWGLQVLLSEFLFIGGFCLLCVIVSKIFNRQ